MVSLFCFELVLERGQTKIPFAMVERQTTMNYHATDGKVPVCFRNARFKGLLN